MRVAAGSRSLGSLMIAAALGVAIIGAGCHITSNRADVLLPSSVKNIVIPPVASEDADYDAYELDMKIRQEAKRSLERLGYHVMLSPGQGKDRYFTGERGSGIKADARLEITVVDLMVEYETQPYIFDIETRARLLDTSSGEVVWQGDGRGHQEDFGQPLGLIYMHKERALAIADMTDWLFEGFPEAP